MVGNSFERGQYREGGRDWTAVEFSRHAAAQFVKFL